MIYCVTGMVRYFPKSTRSQDQAMILNADSQETFTHGKLA